MHKKRTVKCSSFFVHKGRWRIAVKVMCKKVVAISFVEKYNISKRESFSFRYKQ